MELVYYSTVSVCTCLAFKLFNGCMATLERCITFVESTRFKRLKKFKYYVVDIWKMWKIRFKFQNVEIHTKWALWAHPHLIRIFGSESLPTHIYGLSYLKNLPDGSS